MGRRTDAWHSAFRWLTEPFDGLPEPERRRSRLLAWLLASLMVLTVATGVLVLLVNGPESPRRSIYTGVVLGAALLVGLAFSLSRSRHYDWAAGLTIGVAVLGPWASLALDSNILRGDFVPMTYTAVSVMLSSILLPPRVTTLVATAQWLALLLIPVLAPEARGINWPSFLMFFMFTSALSILTNVVSQRDMQRIDAQHGELLLREVQLREQSIRDHLTNLFNRRYLEETLEREIHRARRTEQSLGLIMLDIDHFKRFNDSFGHAAGDALLQTFGEFLNRQVRKSDVACRYGGEEFVLLLPDASLESTRLRAEQIREQAKALSLAHAGAVAVQVTISLGVAAYPDHGDSGAAVMMVADAALYRAKREGRDRVVAAERVAAGLPRPAGAKTITRA